MTREERELTIRYLECIKDNYIEHFDIDGCEETNAVPEYYAIENAIKALEQQPCEDCISRQALDKALYERFHDEDAPNNMTDVRLGAVRNFVKDFQSVTPVACIATVKFSKEDMQELIDEKMKNIVVERKKGKWVNKSHTSDCGIKFVASECTCCGKKTFFDCDQLVYNYCPNCGADMRGKET